MSFNRLKEIRIKKGLTQHDIALKSNIDQSQISRFEKGRNISDKDIIKICKALNVTADYFLKLTNEEKKKWSRFSRNFFFY